MQQKDKLLKSAQNINPLVDQKKLYLTLLLVKLKKVKVKAKKKSELDKIFYIQPLHEHMDGENIHM